MMTDDSNEIIRNAIRQIKEDLLADMLRNSGYELFLINRKSPFCYCSGSYLVPWMMKSVILVFACMLSHFCCCCC